MSKKKGMEGGPAEQARRGTLGGLSEPDVRIPPHETEGSWSVGERAKRTRRAAAERAGRATTTRKASAPRRKTRKTPTKTEE